MHGRAHHHFDGFQVHMPRPAPAVEEHVQPLIYFAGDLLMDRSSRFFSSGVLVLLSDASGRCMHIFSALSENLSNALFGGDLSVCARRSGGGWPANRFSLKRRSSDGDLSCGGGHFTQAAEVGKNPRIPLIAVGVAYLQGSLPEPLEESGFLTALPGSEGAYQPRPQASHGCRMGKTHQFPVV